MLYRKDTIVELDPNGGIPTIRIKADCANTEYEIELETADKESWNSIAKTSQQDQPIQIDDGQVHSARDLNDRRVYWKIGLALTDMNDPSNVPFAVIVEQDGQERSVSIHDNLNFNGSKACLANGYVSLQAS